MEKVINWLAAFFLGGIVALLWVQHNYACLRMPEFIKGLM